MGKPIEDDDNAKEFWENLSDATALDAGTKTALREKLEVDKAGEVVNTNGCKMKVMGNEEYWFFNSSGDVLYVIANHGPFATDDDTKGISLTPLALWFDVQERRFYVPTDITTNDAVWMPLTNIDDIETYIADLLESNDGTATNLTTDRLTLSGNVSSAAWTTTGIRVKGVAATFTDTSSTGTVAAAYTNALGGNTIAASNPVTFTNYITAFYRDPTAGTNVTFTNKFALGAESARFGTSNQVTISNGGVLAATSAVLTNLTAATSSTSTAALVVSGPTSGVDTLRIQGTTTNSYASVGLINSVGAQVGSFGAGGTTAGSYVATLFINGGAGIPISFGINATEAMRISVARGVSIGTSADAGVTNLLVAGTITTSSSLNLPKTITAAATTGAQTIHKPTGSVNFAAAATSLVVTNSLVTTSSVIMATLATNDATAAGLKVVAAAGSFTIYLTTAPTAETRVNFLLTN